MATKHVLKIATIVNFFNEDNKALSKGENAVESGHVEKMEFDAELKLIRGNVHASMKNKVYKVEITLDEPGSITSAQCSCPRGIKCHHIAALLLFAHYNISITDKQCSWRNTKSSKSEQVVTCDEMYPKKPFRAVDRKMTGEELQGLRSQLNNFGATVGFSWLLQEDSAENTSLPVPLMDDIIFSNEFFSADRKENYLRQKCALDDSLIMKVVQETIGQSNNENWFVARKHRLTASNFGTILSACRRNRYPESLFKSLTGMYNLDGVKAIQWGKTHESVAIKNFETATSFTVVQTGIWLTPSGLLGASPDGLVGDNCIIEVKCPYSHRNDELPEKLKNIKSYIIYFNDNGEVQVNKEHHYYDQIQGHLHISNRSACYLVVWTLKGSVIVIINKDMSWAVNLTTLEHFYVNQYIPKLVDNIM